MEKSWENFWTTGKVEDYLTYKNVAEQQKDTREDGTTDRCDGNGAECDAHIGI